MTQQFHYGAYTLKKTTLSKDTCTPLFTAALFIIPRTWKQPRCPPAGEWTKRMWYISALEQYSAIKRNPTGSFVVMWMDLESVVQSKVKEKNKDCINTQ